MEGIFGKFEIVDTVHPKQFLERMNKFRKSKRFCDVKLVVDDREIHGHRTVLALCSPQLDENLELKEDTINIDFETNYDVMTIIVDYMYTGCIKFSFEDAINIWKSLEHLQMKSVLDIFEKYLMDNINDENCIEMFILSEKLDHKELKNLTVAYLVKNLKIFIDSNIFKHLNKNQLETILEEATVCNEAEIIYAAVTNWLKFENDRKDYIENMLKFIKAENLTTDFIRTSILNENYLKSNPSGRQWLVDSFLCDNSPFIQNDQILYIFSRLTPNCSYEYGINEKRLMKKGPSPTLNFASITKHKKTIYVLGGTTETTSSNIGYKYDTTQKLWTQLVCPIGKTCCGICTGDNKIFVIGGMSYLTVQKSCSIYDVLTGQVTSMADMLSVHSNPGVTFYNSSVYVFGGYAGYASNPGFGTRGPNKPLTEIGRYDTREGIWSNAGSIALNSRCSATLISNTIFCLGCDSGEIEKYDPRAYALSVEYNSRAYVLSGVCADIANHRGNSLASINDQLYLAHEEGIAKYNPYNNSWIEVLKEPLQLPVLVV